MVALRSLQREVEAAQCRPAEALAHDDAKRRRQPIADLSAIPKTAVRCAAFQCLPQRRFLVGRDCGRPAVVRASIADHGPESTVVERAHGQSNRVHGNADDLGDDLTLVPALGEANRLQTTTNNVAAARTQLLPHPAISKPTRENDQGH